MKSRIVSGAPVASPMNDWSWLRNEWMHLGLIAALLILNLTGSWLLIRQRKTINRLQKQLGYSKVCVTRVYQNGRIVSERIEPIDDGTLPLPFTDKPAPGTRVPEMDDRATLKG